jgi:hypothetical protein
LGISNGLFPAGRTGKVYAVDFHHFVVITSF